MKQFRSTVIRAGLGALYFTGAHYLLRPIFSGVGAIFMLHHVRPRRDAEFQPTRLDTTTPAAKRAAFDRLHDWLRSLGGDHDIQREVGALCARHGIDDAAICRDLCMSWDELTRVAQDQLVGIGAHSITHCNLA